MSPLKNITSVFYKVFLFSARDNFLSTNSQLTADINYFIQVPVNVNNALSEFYTLLVDLSKPEEEIWKNIYYRTQKEINSFIGKPGYEYCIKYKPDPAELAMYVSLFNRFAERKKIRKAEARRLSAYNSAEILGVSCIKKDGQYICINFYRITRQRASNLHSFHLEGLSPAQHSPSYYGKAHRTLHWLDILEFKKLGAGYYDFCGWYEGSEDQKLLNINAFKEQFTSYKIKEFTGVIYKSRLLRILKKFTG